MWDELWVAAALLLVFEGIMPFLNPQGWRRAMLTLAELDDRSLRKAGLASMLVGVSLLYLLKM